MVTKHAKLLNFWPFGPRTNPLEAAIQHGVSKTNLDIIRSLIAFGGKVEPMLRNVRDEKLLDVLLDYICPLTKGSQLTDASKEAWVATFRSAIHGCKSVLILNLLLDKGLCKLMAKTIETCREEGPALKAVEALINLTDLTCRHVHWHMLPKRHGWRTCSPPCFMAAKAF